MIKKTFKFVDYNGNHRTEDHYFNLTQAEVAELELSVDGGLTAMIKRLVEAQNGGQIIKTMKDLILKSYGVKSPDGRQFIKNQEVRDAFVQTEAYSQLFMELATNAQAASDFVAGIIPAKTDAEPSAEAPALPDGSEALPPA